VFFSGNNKPKKINRSGIAGFFSSACFCAWFFLKFVPPKMVGVVQ
jgi:hypothetical protein